MHKYTGHCGNYGDTHYDNMCTNVVDGDYGYPAAAACQCVQCEDDEELVI